MRSSEIEFETNEYFTLTIEPYFPAVFVHIVVHKFSVKAFKLLKEKSKSLIDKMKEMGYETIYSITKDADKLNISVGGEYVKTVEINNEEYRVYQWQLFQ